MQSVFKTGEITCNQTVSESYEMKTMHVHDVYEIYMAQSKGVKFLVNDRLYELEVGDVMLFSNKDLHKVSVPQSEVYKRYVITFSPEIFFEDERSVLLACFDKDAYGRRDHRLRLTSEEQDTLKALIEALMDERSQSDLSKLGQSLALGRILVFLNRICNSVEYSEVSPTRSRDTRVLAVLEYIDENYDRSITLDELSKHCYLNKYYMCRLFNRETGFCIHDYLIYRRLSAALRLLQKGVSVSQTARLSGFASDTFFITTFKKHFGMTPTQYVNEQRVFYAVDLLIKTDTSIIDVAQLSGFENLGYFHKNFRKYFNMTPGQCRKQYGKESVSLSKP